MSWKNYKTVGIQLKVIRIKNWKLEYLEQYLFLENFPRVFDVIIIIGFFVFQLRKWEYFSILFQCIYYRWSTEEILWRIIWNNKCTSSDTKKGWQKVTGVYSCLRDRQLSSLISLIEIELQKLKTTFLT